MAANHEGFEGHGKRHLCRNRALAEWLYKGKVKNLCAYRQGDAQTQREETAKVEGSEEFDEAGSIETNVGDGFTMVTVGDLMMRRPITVNQRSNIGGVIEILRNSDVTFGNLETCIFDITKFEGSPQVNDDSYHVGVPEVGPDLKAMGFTMLGRANNHVLDWGVEGMRETSNVLDRYGIIHAGVGDNLAKAGGPRYVETRRGRVGLVSLAATFPAFSRAGDSAGEAPGRPGLNALRLQRSITVSEELFESLRSLRQGLPDPDWQAQADATDRERVHLGGATFEVGDKVGYRYEPNAKDVSNIIRNVRQGKQFSDFLIATNHDHELSHSDEYPADYVQEFAHKLIDAGADAYISHGPHILRGIEIYRGRPIFYSLGNFVFDNLQSVEGRDYFDAYGLNPMVDSVADLLVAAMNDWCTKLEDARGLFESVVATTRFEGNRLAEMRLYPIVLGYSERLADRGVPKLASAAQARAILERLQRLSEPFGTQIAIENDIGVIRLVPNGYNVERRQTGNVSTIDGEVVGLS